MISTYAMGQLITISKINLLSLISILGDKHSHKTSIFTLSMRLFTRILQDLTILRKIADKYC